MAERDTVLIVDDTTENLQILMAVLEDEYTVLASKNGERALRLAAGESPPDIILLDIMMPGMDGYEVCQRLKADEATRDIPVIFITALGEAEDEAKGIELGAVDYITKPISPPVVKARVRTHLALTKATKRLKEQNKELLDAAALREDVERITRHDLKNPLCTVLGLPQLMLLSGELSDDHRDMLERVEQAGQTMLDMINSSLDLFKIERGMYELKPHPVNMLSLTARAFRDMEEAAGAKNLTLEALVDGRPAREDDEAFVLGEELLCYSMLGNLLKNAVEASPYDAAVTVDLSRDGDMRRVTVRNRGAVPEEIRDRFFEKYATSGKASGTGLGSYSARLNAQAQNGEMDFATSEEEGTAVWARLPLAPTPA